MDIRHLNSRRLPVFAAASLGLHIVLLLATATAVPHVTIEPTSTLTISVDIEPPAPAPAAAISAATIKRPRHEPTTQAVAQAAPPAAPSAPDAGAIADDKNGTGQRSDELRSWAVSQLLGDLRRHFEYPLLARHRGWEGTVWLSFVVAPDGELERIHVARGSGYDALDRSALTDLRRIGSLPEARTRLGGRALELELPVIYRLSE
ncbi:MAG: energy transducer TonB [Gammaproteobacteria bacterium]